MQKFEYTIHQENGIHARPAGLLVRKAQSYQSSATIIHEGKSADMKHLFTLLGLNIKQGNSVTPIVRIKKSWLALTRLSIPISSCAVRRSLLKASFVL